MRSMLTAPEAHDAMRTFLRARIDELAGDDGDPDAALRAALAVSSILGMTLARHFFDVEELAGLTDDQRERVVRPWLQGVLGDRPAPS